MWVIGKKPPDSYLKALRVAVVVLAIGALAVSLATRTFRTTINQGRTFRSDSSQAIRQHLDRDAARWIAPAVRYAVLDAPTFYPHVTSAEPRVLALVLDESLYNRPPPAAD